MLQSRDHGTPLYTVFHYGATPGLHNATCTPKTPDRKLGDQTHDPHRPCGQGLQIENWVINTHALYHVRLCFLTATTSHAHWVQLFKVGGFKRYEPSNNTHGINAPTPSSHRNETSGNSNTPLPISPYIRENRKKSSQARKRKRATRSVWGV